MHDPDCKVAAAQQEFMQLSLFLIKHDYFLYQPCVGAGQAPKPLESGAAMKNASRVGSQAGGRADLARKSLANLADSALPAVTPPRDSEWQFAYGGR